MHRWSNGVFQESRFALNLFLKSVLQKLQSLHDHDFQWRPRAPGLLDNQDDHEPVDAAHVRCKVLAELLRFLAFEDDAAVVAKLREMSQRLPGKLNLEGWHSDHKNLYFINEESPETGSQQQQQDEETEGNKATGSNLTRAAIARSYSSIVEESEVSPAASSLALEDNKELIK